MTPDTLRYYGRSGVVGRPPRPRGGFRVYSVAVLERLRFKQAQRQGLTLAKIRELPRLDARPRADQCEQVQRLLEPSSPISTGA